MIIRACTVEGAYTIGGYSETSLVLKTKFGLINFDGAALKIERMSLEMLSFTGEIHKIEYLGFQVPQRTLGGKDLPSLWYFVLGYVIIEMEAVRVEQALSRVSQRALNLRMCVEFRIQLSAQS